MTQRVLAKDVRNHVGSTVLLKGWLQRIRETKSTTFLVLQDRSGTIQVVAAPSLLEGTSLQTEDAVEIRGSVRADERASGGCELDLGDIRVVGKTKHPLPFGSTESLDKLNQEPILNNRALSLRTSQGNIIFRVQAALIEGFRASLRSRGFTEIVTSKIVSSGTEGGSNLFELNYFDRVAYLAQSPQFYKEHCVAGLERVFETGHVYRAEPHATSRHLTEYYSMDFEVGFIDDVTEIIELEREVLDEMFGKIREEFKEELGEFNAYLPSMKNVPIWDFDYCLEMLEREYDRTDLEDDLDPLAERQICELAAQQCGVEAAFVVGFPMTKRPFYTHPQEETDKAAGFDLIFRGLEITTGGQRLHERDQLEAALRERGLDPSDVASHLRVFEFGMPPHGGLAIGAERLTAQVLGLKNVREATMYPRDRHRVEP